MPFESGELVFVGSVDAPEDVGTPSTIVLERMDAVLRAAGLGLKDPSAIGRSCATWQRQACAMPTDVSVLRDRIRSLRPTSIPQTPASAAPRLAPALRSALYAVATRGRRQYVESKFARRTPRVFAQQACARATGCSSPVRMPWTSRSKPLFVGDLRAQTEQCVRQLQFIMEAAGGTMDDIVKTTVYVLDGQDRAVFLDAYGEQVQAAPAESVDACRPHHDGRRAAPRLPGGDRRRRMARARAERSRSLRLRFRPYQQLLEEERPQAGCSVAPAPPAIPCLAPQLRPGFGGQTPACSSSFMRIVGEFRSRTIAADHEHQDMLLVLVARRHVSKRRIAPAGTK